MSTTITLNRFDGGIAEDQRDTSAVKVSNAVNVNLSAFPNKVVPHVDLEAEALSSGDITDKLFTDVDIDDNGSFYAIGRNGSGSPTVINTFTKDSTTDISATYTSASTLSAGALAFPFSEKNYQNKIFIITNESNAVIRNYDGSWNNLGNMGAGSVWTDMGVPKPYRHPADDLLYLAARHKVYRTNSAGTSASSYFTFPDKYLSTSMTNWGNDLAISLSPRYGGNSYVAILDRISTNTTPRNLVDWGPGSLCVLENVNGVLIGISTNELRFNAASTFTVAKTKKIYIKAWAGGEVVTLKELEVGSTVQLTNRKQLVGDKLYFGCNNDDALYCFTKNKEGNYIVYKSHYMANGTTVTNLTSFNFLGDYLFTMVNTAGSNGLVYRTDNTDNYTNSSYIETLKNQGMSIGDRAKKKKLKAVSVSKSSTTGQLVVSVSVDGGAYQTVSTLAASGALNKKETRLATGGPFTDGYEFKFKVVSTSGGELTELKYEYEVIEKTI